MFDEISWEHLAKTAPEGGDSQIDKEKGRDMSLNRVMVTGNLVADVEVRMTKSGTEVLSARIAVDDWIRSENGEWIQRPNYFDLVAFGQRWDGAARYLKKGMKLAVDGQLRQTTWTTQDGQNRSRVEIVANRIDFMSAQNSTTAQNAETEQMPTATTMANDYAGTELYDEEVDF